jgi:hypothetical protein
MRAQRGPILLALLLVANAAWAEDDPMAGVETEVERVWSATIIGDFKIISQDRHAENDVGSFFDQYEFTPNKSKSVPFELGLRDFSYDRFGPDQTPQLQLRFDSPTSNLGISGSEADEPFFNQRAQLFERFDETEFDLKYWRHRTEDLRLFPNTNGRQFDDQTESDDRFSRERTGLFAELRLRPGERVGTGTESLEWLAPEISLRGGFEHRDGTQQARLIQDVSNRWAALSQSVDQDDTKIGGGLLVAPGGLFTMTFDFDYDRFRHDSSTITASDLGPGFVQGDDAIGFIADTDRMTGAVLVQSRIGERAVLESGFHVSRLKQVNDYTPTQQSSGLKHNELLFYSVNAAADVMVSDRVTVNAFIKYDQRKNKIDRDTPLFNPQDDGVQVGPFLKRWDRIYSGAEAVYSLHRSNIVAMGARYEWIDRDLDFAETPILVVPESNVRINDRTEMWTLYGRTSLRPLKGLGISGEIGYRGAPETGYILDLDKYVYGKLRTSYVIPIEPYVVMSAFVRGGSGKNKDFSMTNGTGADPAGSKLGLKFERQDVTWGLTVMSYPVDDVSVYASFFQTYDKQNYELVGSTLQRYLQGLLPVDYFEDGGPDHSNNQLSFSLGTHVRFSDNTDANLSYTFTRAKLDYDNNASANVAQIEDNRVIDSDIHGVQMELGHWLRDGLRIQAGYRLQLFDDSSARTSDAGSVVRSNSPDQTQHTVTLGVTLNSDLFARSKSEPEPLLD